MSYAKLLGTPLMRIYALQALAMQEAGLVWFYAPGHWREQTGWLPLCHDGSDY
jgi:hypothetical protein